MQIKLSEDYLDSWEVVEVTGADGVETSEWSGDFNDAGELTFHWKDSWDVSETSYGNGTIYLHVKEQSHIFKLTDGSVDLGSIMWKEGPSNTQLTRVQAYLNYELVYTSEFEHISNSLNNFDLTVNGGYYFDTESMQNIRWESDVPGQSFTLTPVGDYNKLTFGVVPSAYGSEYKNTVKLYFFTYDEDSGLKVDFNRFIDNNSAHPDLDEACPALDISFTHNGVDYAFVYDTFSADASGLESFYAFLPYDTDITVKPRIQSGYQFICWLSEDNWVEGNNLYSIQSNGNWIQEITGAAGLQKGRIAFTETMGMRYAKDSAFQNGIVSLYMTTDDSTWAEADKITYHPNYEGATEGPVVQYVWNRYGTLIKENMFTREGYTFVEWNTKPDGSGVAYDPYDPYENHTDMDLYAQWKEDTQPEPEIPDPADSIDDLTGAVNVICSTNAHAQAAYGVLGTENTDWTLSWTEGAETATITVEYTPYVTKYNQDNPSVEHIYDSSNAGNDLTVELKYENDAWTVDDAADVYVKEDENPDAKLTKMLDKVERDGAEITLAPGEMLKVDDVLTYTITVTNTGNTELTGLIVTDTFGGAGEPEFPADKTPTENPDGTYTWTIQSLAAGGTWTVTYTYTVVDEDADAESLVNDASVTGDDLDGDDDDEGGTETDVENPDAQLTKELTEISRNGEAVTVEDDTALKVGDEITYEITVENTGNVALENLTVTDTFDGAGELEFLTGNAPTENPDGTYTWTIADLAVDDTWTVTCTYTVVQADAGDTLKNAAAVEGDELDEPGTDPDDPTPPEDDDERDVTDDDDDDQKPGDDDDQKPGDDDDQKPGDDDSQKPGGDDGQQPGGDDDQKPGDDGQKPGGDDSQQSGDDGDGKDNGDDAKIPPTGDNTPVTLLFTLTLAAAGGLTTVLVLRKRRDGKA